MHGMGTLIHQIDYFFLKEKKIDTSECTVQ